MLFRSPAGGEIYISGKNSADMTVSDISREIGFVMQNPDNQLFTDTIYNEAAFALKNYGLSKKEIKKRVEEALCAVGLEKYDSFPHACSKADRTKIVIACILAMGCKIIILDEIDVGQDYIGITKIMNILKKQQKQGCTIIFVTHNMLLANEYANNIIELGGTNE